MDIDEPSPRCRIGRGERVSVTDPRLDKCSIEPGSVLYFEYSDEPIKKGRVKMSDPKSLPVSYPDAGPAIAPTVTQAPAPLPAPAVAVPNTATDELSKLVPANGQMSGLTVILAAIAVLGGGAAWKFYSQHSKEKHEQKMKELELRAAQSNEQHPSCKTDSSNIHSELRKLSESTSSNAASINDMSAKINRIESRFSPDMADNFDELETRLRKLERKLPRVGRTTSKLKSSS